MFFGSVPRLLFALIVATPSLEAAAQAADTSRPAYTSAASLISATRPGRDPNQPIDEDEMDVPQGRAPLDPRNDVARRRPVELWQAAPVTDEQLRNPLAVIPPALRPRVILRFSDQRELLASGLLDGNDVAQRPAVVDVPLAKGHVILFANNPMYRGETIGSYFLVFNALLNFDHLDTGRKLDQR